MLLEKEGEKLHQEGMGMETTSSPPGMGKLQTVCGSVPPQPSTLC